jgi:hypothetical protein
MGARRTAVLQAAVLVLWLLVPAAFGAEYHVAPDGDDEGPGSADRPFRTIQQAARAAGPGDLCHVHAGVYKETVELTRSGRPGEPIRFAAAPGQRVLLDGTEPVPGLWAPHEGSVFSAPVPETFEQLFVDRRMMIEARWPNASFEEMLERSRWAKADKGSRYGRMVSSELARTGADWTGALAHLNIAHQYWTWTRNVLSHQAGSNAFTYATDCRGALVEGHYDEPTGWRAGLWEDDYFYLSGKLEALDSPTEWFLDEAGRRLYLWADDGGDPSGRRVEYKKRAYAFDARSVEYVELRGFEFFATTFRFRKSNHCAVEDCRLLFPTYSRRITDRDPERSPSPVGLMEGDDNAVRRVGLAYANHGGLRMWGERNVVENCIVHDVNWPGYLGYGAVTMRPPWGSEEGHGGVVRGSTLYNCGNAIIEFNGLGSIVEASHVYNGGLAAKDVALVYTQRHSTAGSVVRRNWVHGCHTDPWLGRDGPGGIGIRGDDRTRRLTVHHNVVWDCGEKGIVVKGDGNGVFNNTVLHVGAGGQVGHHIVLLSGPERADKGPAPLQEQNVHTEAVNNIARAVSGGPSRPLPQGARLEANYDGDAPPLLGTWEGDFRPRGGSPLVDAGVVVPGVTDGYVGPAPDIGAYELGGEHWQPGADWLDEWNAYLAQWREGD